MNLEGSCICEKKSACVDEYPNVNVGFLTVCAREKSSSLVCAAGVHVVCVALGGWNERTAKRPTADVYSCGLCRSSLCLLCVMKWVKWENRKASHRKCELLWFVPLEFVSSVCHEVVEMREPLGFPQKMWTRVVCAVFVMPCTLSFF